MKWTDIDRKQLENLSDKFHKLEKSVQKLCNDLFGEEGYIFENRWQTGLPKGEEYESHDNGNTFMSVVVSETRIHIILKGVKDTKQIKKMVESKYSLVD